MAARFRCVDEAVIRVAVLGGGLNLPPWPDLTGGTPEHMQEWRSWLVRVWEQEALVEAIEVASPVLARRVGDVCSGQVLQPRRVRRVVESVIRYLLRMTSRATPFGLFAGVAPLSFGSRASVRWGEPHRAVTRPDSAWLAEVITQLEARPEVLRRLPVTANNLGFVRGDRLVVPCQQRPGVPGGARPADVSVRHTSAESTGLLASWFFIRKQWWRFRYMPASSTSVCAAKKFLEDAARFMQDSGYAARWVENIYEPETHAFGGEEGMAAAHNLFHQDSRHIFEHRTPLSDSTLNSAPNGQSKRREISVLLCAALMKAAGQDRYEQGDIWARVADHRPMICLPTARPGQEIRFHGRDLGRRTSVR